MKEVQAEVAALDRAVPELPSLGVAGKSGCDPERRQQFLDDFRSMLQDLSTRYGGVEGDAFKLAVAWYPKEGPDEWGKPAWGTALLDTAKVHSSVAHCLSDGEHLLGVNGGCASRSSEIRLIRRSC